MRLTSLITKLISMKIITPGYMFTLDQIEAMPTIYQGHTDDLKIETPITRVWLSRLTVEDGMPYNNMVTVDSHGQYGWETINEYEAK